MIKWLGTLPVNAHLKGQFPKPSTLGLPDPNQEKNPADAGICFAANNAIDDAVRADAAQPKSKKKRGPYHRYDADLRARMAKFANMHGLTRASKHFTAELGHEVTYTTIQSIQRQFKMKLQKVADPAKIRTLPHLPRGRPLLLGPQLDALVCKHLRAVRSCGGIVNRRITLATGVGVVRAKSPSLLAENGGGLTLTKFWADSVLKRLQFTKRKGTKAAKKLPEDFSEVKQNFLDRVTEENQGKQHPAKLSA